VARDLSGEEDRSLEASVVALTASKTSSSKVSKEAGGVRIRSEIYSISSNRCSGMKVIRKARLSN